MIFIIGVAEARVDLRQFLFRVCDGLGRADEPFQEFSSAFPWGLLSNMC
ncbi:hypothetical protein RAH42_09435 [Pyramidobacter sp. YE332]|nr:hypothetical protein [Pyramidobacter sp. YE332]WOL39363.1 hypothetical protein RAH42_09435 [Pyramidobacter sp. YE332]